MSATHVGTFYEKLLSITIRYIFFSSAPPEKTADVGTFIMLETKDVDIDDLSPQVKVGIRKLS